jgi:hypothetical protein
MTSPFKPLYAANNYKEFVAWQKQKGLRKKYWKDLPEMWKNEKESRAEFEALFN